MNPECYVHVPAQLLPARLGFLLNRRLQPEIACQDVSIDQLDFKRLGDCAATLAAEQLGTTLHAPFSGFNPGSSRRRIRKFSQELALRSLQLAEAIRATKIIFHPGIAYGSSPRKLDFWLEQNVAFWPEYIRMAESFNCCLCLENIYETVPDSLLALCRELAAPNFGHCFDIGHWNIFGTVQLRDWLEQIAPWLRHLHLHDNFGEQDEHLPIGQGQAGFSILFNWLKEHGIAPSFTLEAHNLPDLDISLAALQRYLPGE